MRFKLSLLLRRAWWKGLALFVSLNLLLLSLRHFRHEVPAGGLKVIGYGCQPGFRCGGWADRQKGIVAAFVIAAILGQEFKVSMPTPCDVGFFLSPRGTVDWRLEPGEMTGRNVAWWDMTSHVWDDFVQEFLSLEDPLVLFEADYTFIMANMETVHLLRKHRLAQKITWLQELTVPEIYRLVLTELFDLMPGPRVQFDAFRQALPRDVTLVCAQAFLLFDRDKSGYMNLRELQEVLCSIGDHMELNEVAMVLKAVDVNGDGKVDVEEFIDFLCDKV